MPARFCLASHSPGRVPAARQVTRGALDWNASQQCWHAWVDDWGESSQPGIFVVGDAAGIGGATVAQCSGELAGLQTAHQLGFVGLLERDRMAVPIRRRP